MNSDLERVLLDEQTIQEKIVELGKRLKEDYDGQNPIVICVLKGAVLFLGDLIKRMEFPLEIDFMATSSYGSSTESSGEVRIMKDLDRSVDGRHLLIVEDIIDTGLTLSYLIDTLKRRNAASVKVVTLLDKPERRKNELTPDYCGFTVPDEFVVGYGLDYDEKYRNLPYIGVLRREIYER